MKNHKQNSIEPGHIAELATLGNAREWESTEEKFTFCIDLLEISAHDQIADCAVNALETAFNLVLNN